MDKNKIENSTNKNYQYVNGIIMLKALSKVQKNIVKLLGFNKENEKLTIITKISTDNKHLGEKVSREYELLSNLNHANILKVNIEKYTFKTNKNIYYVEEYLNVCNLSKFIEEFKNTFNRPPTESIIQHITRQLIEGVTYLHEKKIIHRNLNTKSIMLNIDKLERFCEINNISISLINELIVNYKIDDLYNLYMKKLFSINDISLFEENFIEYVQVKIIDLGIAKELNTDFSTNTIFLINKGAPETKKGDYSFPSDFWSIGIITFELLTGSEYIPSEDYVDEKKLPESIYCSNKIINFINLLLERSPNKRRENFMVIKNNPFLSMIFKEEQKINIEKKENGIKSFNSKNSFLKNYFEYVDEDDEGKKDIFEKFESNSFCNEKYIGDFILINESYLDSLYTEQITKVVEYQENEYSLDEFFIKKTNI